ELRVAAEDPDHRGARDRQGGGDGEQPGEGDPAGELPAHAGGITFEGPGDALALPPLARRGDESFESIHNDPRLSSALSLKVEALDLTPHLTLVLKQVDRRNGEFGAEALHLFLRAIQLRILEVVGDRHVRVIRE